MYKKGFLLSIILLLFVSTIILKDYKDKLEENNSNFIKRKIPVEPKKPEIKSPDISDYIFAYKEYDEIINIFKNYENQSPELIDVYEYGKSSQGKSLNVIKISNERNPGKYRVLVTSCIHGNEPLSTSVTMSYMSYLLSKYDNEEEIKNIIDETVIYYVPVVSPDSYPNRRHVNSLDPNRDFPTMKNPDKESVLVVENLKKLFLDIKPNSVLSGHTFGRVFLIPWGDTRKDCPDHDSYVNIIKEMSKLSNYKWKKISELYGHPIFGTESDWYYRNGAFSIVMEFGTHQRKPSFEDTKYEFERTLDSFIYFIKKSPKIKLL